MVTTPARTHLPLRHAVLLVLGVLAVHVWVLRGAPRWLMPAHDASRPTATRVFVTREIVLPTPADRAADRTVRRAASPARASTHPTPQPADAAAPDDATLPRTLSPQEIDDIVRQYAAPVALPERSASAVDLPPFNRPTAAPGDTPVEPTAFKPPASTRLTYSVQGMVKQFNYFASGELLWRQDGAHYDARLEIGAFLLGSRVQTSSGELGAEGLQPTRFGDKTRSELAAHFQRDKGIISFSANTPDVPLLKGAQDRLSIVLQLSALLAADPQRFPPGTTLSFQTVSQREAEVWQFAVEKTETLDLPYGSLATVKLIRKPRREFDQQIEIWFAPTLDYLPVRLRIDSANGDQVDQQLRGIERP